MSAQDPSVTAIVAAIESSADGRWGVWLSDTGWWWAARTRALTAHELSAGCIPHIHADDPHELAERIREQDHLCADAPADDRSDPDRKALPPRATRTTALHDDPYETT